MHIIYTHFYILKLYIYTYIYMLFSFRIQLLLYVTGGSGALEHPAPPKNEDLASIWRTPLALLLVALPGFRRVDFAQGLLGAKSAKPTSFLSLNLPSLVDRIWQDRVCDELPQTSSIGRDLESGVRLH